jgi:hypothetical protein
MPQRRKQQKGAGLLDILSSDPAKKIEANNKRIGELEKESEQKCADLKKKNDLKIADLKKKNEVLQKAADDKKVKDVKEAESGSFFDGVKNFFGPKADEAKAPIEAKEGEAKPVSDMNVVKNPMLADAGPQAVAGPQAIAEAQAVGGPQANVGPQGGPRADAGPQGGPQANVGQEAQKDNVGRMFGGKKSKRRRGSKARKSAKK